MKNACKGCEERALGCHGTCERYAKALSEYHFLKARAAPNTDAIAYGVARAAKIKKALRRNNK